MLYRLHSEYYTHALCIIYKVCHRLTQRTARKSIFTILKSFLVCVHSKTLCGFTERTGSLMCHCFGYFLFFLQDMFDFETTRACLLACLPLSPSVCLFWMLVRQHWPIFVCLLSLISVFPLRSFARKDALECIMNELSKEDTVFNHNRIWWIGCCHFHWVQTWTVDTKWSLQYIP